MLLLDSLRLLGNKTNYLAQQSILLKRAHPMARAKHHAMSAQKEWTKRLRHSQTQVEYILQTAVNSRVINLFSLKN